MFLLIWGAAVLVLHCLVPQPRGCELSLNHCMHSLFPLFYYLGIGDLFLDINIIVFPKKGAFGMIRASFMVWFTAIFVPTCLFFPFLVIVLFSCLIVLLSADVFLCCLTCRLLVFASCPLDKYDYKAAPTWWEYNEVFLGRLRRSSCLFIGVDHVCQYLLWLSGSFSIHFLLFLIWTSSRSFCLVTNVTLT